MNEIRCEDVRDLLPELIGDQLDAVTSATLRAHVAQCAECEAEYAIASLVAGSRLSVPSGLEQRVVAAAGRRTTYWTRGRMAAAASIAVALIGGSTWLSQLLPTQRKIVTQPPLEAAAPGGGFIGVDDAFVSGTSSLGDLTVEELKKLLVEMES